MLWSCERDNDCAGCIQGNEFRIPLKYYLSQEGLCYLEMVSLCEDRTPSISSKLRVKLCTNAACHTSCSNARGSPFVRFLISLSLFCNG